MSGWGWVIAGYGLTFAVWVWLAWLSRAPEEGRR